MKPFAPPSNLTQYLQYLSHMTSPSITPPFISALPPQDSAEDVIVISDSPQDSPYALDVIEVDSPTAAETQSDQSFPSSSHFPDNPWSAQVADLNAFVFGNTDFRPMQREAIDAVMENRDVFVCMQTGAGKSLIYQIPALMSTGVTVVVMPLLSLIRDQASKLHALKINCCAFTTGMSTREKDEGLDHFLTDDSLPLVLLTPERIERSSTVVTILERLYEQQRIARFVIDEAHCVSKWGRTFREDYLKLASLRANFPSVPIVCMTATASERVQEDIETILSLRDVVRFRTSGNRPNLRYSVIPKDMDVLRSIGTYILKEHLNETGLIYCLSINDTVLVAAHLATVYKLSISHYHAGLKADERVEIETKWKHGVIRILASTIAFGMGIDKPDVRFVIHHSVPMSVDNYAQESGRAGRDGHPSDCILYYSSRDRQRNQFLLSQSTKTDDETYGAQVTLLDVMIAYCEDRVKCRRSMLLAFFGEDFPAERCGKTCDNCQSVAQVERKDVTSVAKGIVRFVGDIECFGLADMMWKIRQRGEEGSSDVWREVQALSKEDVEMMYRKLLLADLIEYKGTKSSAALHPSRHSASFLSSTDPFYLELPVVPLTAPAQSVQLFRPRRRRLPPLFRTSLPEGEKQELLSVLTRVRDAQIGKPGKTVLTQAELRSLCELLPTTRKQAAELGLNVHFTFIDAIRNFLCVNRKKQAKTVIALDE